LRAALFATDADWPLATFLGAHRFFMAILRAFRPSAVIPPLRLASVHGLARQNWRLALGLLPTQVLCSLIRLMAAALNLRFGCVADASSAGISGFPVSRVGSSAI